MITSKTSRLIYILIIIIVILFILMNQLLNKLVEIRDKTNGTDGTEFYKKEVESLKIERDNLQRDYNAYYLNWTNLYTCPKFSELGTDKTSPVNIVSADEKYFYHYSFHPNGFYIVCDATDKENPKPFRDYEARIQNGDWMIITTYGDLLFFANLKNKTLNYISAQDLPNANGDTFFFGPQAFDINSFSPSKNKVVIEASGCHDCDTFPNDYVLNLVTGKVTKLGLASGITWLDDNTVKWMELNIRDRTPEEYAEDPYAFPVVVENKGYVITQL